MKNLFVLLALSISLSSQASNITLQPGSSIDIEASQYTTITCAGTIVSQNTTPATCRILKRRDTFTDGRICNYDFCAEIVKYETTTYIESFHSSGAAANWCDSRLNP